MSQATAGVCAAPVVHIIHTGSFSSHSASPRLRVTQSICSVNAGDFVPRDRVRPRVTQPICSTNALLPTRHSPLFILLFLLVALDLNGQQNEADLLLRLPECRDLALPYQVDESSIVLPPGTFVSDDLIPVLIGGDPGSWHVWIVGRLQGYDSIIPLVLKFEGEEADYVDVYFLVVYDRAGRRLRTELLAVFANIAGRYTTSEATIDRELRVRRRIEW